MKILIVDREEDFFITKNVLSSIGHTHVILVRSVEETYEELYKNEIDLILININSNEINVIDFCKSIRLIKTSIPIIGLTEYTDSSIIGEALNSGMDDYIKKPFTAEDLKLRTSIVKNTKLKVHNYMKKEEELNYIFKEYGLDINSLKEDIILAKRLQKCVLSTPLSDKNIKIDAKHISCKDLAGDLYCWFQIDKYRYGIILIDVMGHGISSALISMSVRSLLKGIITRVSDPVKVINELNKHMTNLYSGDVDFTSYYYSAIYMVIDTQAKTIEYVNAGHPPGLVIFKDGSFKHMSEGTIPVGLMSNIEINKEKFLYEDIVSILLYTDGVFDAMNLNPYSGIKKLEELLCKFHKESNDSLIREISGELCSKGEFKDDICFITIKIGT